MPLRATAGVISSRLQGAQKEQARDLAELQREKPLIFNRVKKDLDALREQRNRENNRTITGAYQGENRRVAGANRLLPKLHMRRLSYAK
jgi:hypothetical protein